MRIIRVHRRYKCAKIWKILFYYDYNVDRRNYDACRQQKRVLHKVEKTRTKTRKTIIEPSSFASDARIRFQTNLNKCTCHIANKSTRGLNKNIKTE